MSKRFYNSFKQIAGAHGFSIISLLLIWHIKKVFVDKKELHRLDSSTTIEEICAGKRENGKSCFYM